MSADARGERTELAGGKIGLDYPAPAVARLTISNPTRRNALDHDILGALAETMPQLDRGIEIRCVVITGEGEMFSAGYDIGGIPDQTFSTDAEALVAHPFHAAMEAGGGPPPPPPAALNGPCPGGGPPVGDPLGARPRPGRAHAREPPAEG